MADFVTKVFGEFLTHTPITHLGINRSVHFSVGTEANRNRIGRTLAPIAPWGEWGTKIEAAPPETRGGFRSLVMQETKANADVSGHVQVSIQPSLKIPSNAAIFMNINDEYRWSKSDSVGCERVIRLLATEFEKSLRYSEWIIDQVMALKGL